MKKDSHYSKSFHSDDMTRSKYDEFMSLAVKLRNVRNELARIVNDDLLKYVDLSKIDFQKVMLPIIKDIIQDIISNKLWINVCHNVKFNVRDNVSNITNN